MTSNNQELSDTEEIAEKTKQSPKLPENDLPLGSATTQDEPAFGWSNYAERVNGRFAMLGFLAILLIEVLSKSNFLQWAGFIS